jgi:hypothetical protein
MTAVMSANSRAVQRVSMEHYGRCYIAALVSFICELELMLSSFVPAVPCHGETGVSMRLRG